MKAVECKECVSSDFIQLKEIEKPTPKDHEAAKAKDEISKFKTVCAFFVNGSCSKTLMSVLNREFDHPMELEEHATHPLAGGLMQGYQCGMLWGATLAAGAQAYRLFGSDPQAEAKAVIAAQRLVESFRAQNNTINCLEITETDPRNKWQVFWNFFVKGGTFRCMGRAADYAPEAFSETDAALSEKHNEAPCHPASCAAMLAKKMGASDMHAVMASGFAGGIGLSGGACGALGAAIWIIGMNGRKEGLANKVIHSRISNTIDSFLKSAGYEFECSEIVGRRFENIGDHADFLRQGGCSEIIEALAEAAGVVRDHRPTPADKEAVYYDSNVRDRPISAALRYARSRDHSE